MLLLAAWAGDHLRLMGVINMAHGELLMIGAYATYVVQNLFRAYRGLDWYLRSAHAGGLPERRRSAGAGARRHPPVRPAAEPCWFSACR